MILTFIGKHICLLLRNTIPIMKKWSEEIQKIGWTCFQAQSHGTQRMLVAIIRLGFSFYPF
jgi:hypothetical protein